MSHIRIVSDQRVVTNAKILFVGDDGAETDMSTCVQGVDIRLHVGDIATATLHVIVKDVDASALVDELIATSVERKPWWQAWWQRPWLRPGPVHLVSKTYRR